MLDDAPPSSSSSVPTIQIDSLDGERLERSVIAAYVSGCPAVRLDATPTPEDTVEDRTLSILERLEGASPSRIEEARLEVRFETPTVEDPFAKVDDLHAEVQTLLSIAEQAIAEQLDPPARRRLEEAEQRCDQILFHLLRQDNRDPDWPAVDCQTAMDSAERLERIADYAYGIAGRAQDLTPQERVGLIADRLVDAVGEVRGHVDRAHEALQSPDFALGQQTVEAVLDWSATLEEEAVSLAGSPREPEQLPAQRLYRGYFSLLEDTQRVGLYAKSIAEAGIDRATASLAAGPDPTFSLSGKR